MKLTIISPQHKQEYSVQWIEAHSPAGSLIIKPGHAPIILSLLSGSDLSFVLDNDEKRMIRLKRSCFLQVTRDGIVALMGQAL